MCLNLNCFLFYFSPLEQFEISAYNTTLSYITTYPVELFEQNYIINYKLTCFSSKMVYLISLISLILFQFIIEKNSISVIINNWLSILNRKNKEEVYKEFIYLKNKYNFFIFLYIFLIVIFTCINFYGFSTIAGYYTTYTQGHLNTVWEGNLQYITLNTSFINIYTVFFCFIFIFLIIYLLFNKSLSNHTNNLIPEFYQMIGESIYKISLNLFHSVLGKHLTHPEFFIKICTVFLFLIISNVQGMIPYMSTLTSALTNTFFIALALFISIITTLLDKKGINYFLNLFMPSGCPIFLVLLLIPIEIISYSFRVVSLSVRLFANMMAGHTLLKVIVGFSWVIVFLGNTSLINLFPIVILFVLTLLEFGVAFIQSYIFTILSCIYLRDIFQGH